MKKIILLICLFLFSGCTFHRGKLVSESIINSKCTYEMNEEYIALHMPIKSLFNDTKLQLYTLDTLEKMQSVSFNESNQTYGFYQNGYYTISLDKNIAHLYSYDGKETQVTINGMFSREKWGDAFLSFDGEVVYYLYENTLYAWNIEAQAKSEVHSFNNEVLLMSNNENGAYVLVDDAYYKIKNDKIEIVENIDYVDEHYYINKIDEKILQLTNVSTSKETLLTMENENEEIITSNTNGIVTYLESSLYYYAVNEHLVYRFDIENLESVVIDENNHFYVVSTDREIEKYTLEDSVKVNVLIENTRSQWNGTKIIEAPIMSQLPDYPTGCETISTIMLLHYLGEDISPDTFVDEYLDKGSISYSNGIMYAPNPYRLFVGSPYTDDSYGCFVPVIEEALTQYYGSDKYIDNTTGLTLEELCHNYIDRDYPVLVWASISMVDIYESQSWITPEGDTFTWLANEHCLLLVGYDEYYYYFNDPWTGSRRAFSKSLVEDRYQTLGSQSITILNNK